MSRQVCDHKLFAARRRDDHVEIVEHFCYSIHRHSAGTRGLDVLHSGNEARRSKRIRPVIIFLRSQQLVFSRARQLIEGRRRFRRQHRYHGVVRKFWHFDRREIHAHLTEFRECGIVVFSVVLCPCARGFPPLFSLFAFLLFFGSRGRFFLGGFLLLLWLSFGWGF